MGFGLEVRWMSMAALLNAACAFGQSTASCGIVAVKHDAVRDLRWALVVDCDHSQRPARWVPAGRDVAEMRTVAVVSAPAVAVQGTAPLVVKAGETVRVSNNGDVVRMQTTGVAQESGTVGKRIRVRLLRQGMESAAEERFVTGVVIGPGSVEMGR